MNFLAISVGSLALISREPTHKSQPDHRSRQGQDRFFPDLLKGIQSSSLEGILPMLGTQQLHVGLQRTELHLEVLQRCWAVLYLSPFIGCGLLSDG